MAEFPLLGEICAFEQKSESALRVWQVRGFENWLIFYRPISDGVEIVRVLHGARDVVAILQGDV
ncbi:MAG: type II toxin-antitoxin system RelE/ParE family toxin [Pirellulales bacterium]